MASDAADCFQKICDFENQGIHAVCVPKRREHGPSGDTILQIY